VAHGPDLEGDANERTRLRLTPSLGRRTAAEALGTALLLAVVVGSGIMGDRLAGGNVAVALLANTLATGAGLVVLISVFGPLSGAHFNPAVSLVEAAAGRLRVRELGAYVGAQVLGGAVGVLFAHAMFEEPLLQLSTHARTGPAQWLAEAVATFGLLTVILGSARRAPERTPVLVGLYITSAYWFTSSTSFANPAVTVARALTDTFAGIRPADVAGFVVAQLAGAGLAAVVWPRLDPSE
jgi:glycerol uptake facilitator-like aquaporin